MKNQKGITLIETMFGIFTVTLATLALAATLPTASISRRKADYSTKAVSIAQKQLENMRYIGFGSINDEQLRTVNNPLTNSLYIDSSSQEDGPYTFTNVDVGYGDSPANVLPSGTAVMTITDINSNTKQIVVAISWTDRNGAHVYTAGTIIANL